MKRIVLTATVIAVAAVATAPAPAADTAAIAPHVWSTKIAGASPAVLNGTWRLTMKASSFSVAKGASLAVAGSAKIAGNRVTFHDLAGPFACNGAQATGVYRWRVSGKRLTMAAVSEPCAGRKTILTKPFTRVL
jgi:hypothetical protein